MSRRKKDPPRILTSEERIVLEQISHSYSEPAGQVARSKIILAVTESIQRILKRRALEEQSPETPEDIITLFEATARGWNCCPTPFVWGGRRAARRERSRPRRHAVGGSGACTYRPVRRQQTKA